MGSKFRVGDRVAVYGSSLGGQNYSGMRGTISKTPIDNFIRVDVELSEGRVADDEAFHFKQCRALKKKERRRVWVHRNAVSDKRVSESWSVLLSKDATYADSPHSIHNDWIEFIEVRKGKA